MKRKITFSILTCIALGCQQHVDSKTESEKLMQLSKEWSQFATSRNVEKTLSYWADDAMVISAGDPVLKGKEEIRKMVEGSYKNPSFQISWEPQSAEVSKSGDLAYLIENTKIMLNDSTGNQVIHKYKAVTIWKKQENGSWKDIVDVLSPLEMK